MTVSKNHRIVSLLLLLPVTIPLLLLAVLDAAKWQHKYRQNTGAGHTYVHISLTPEEMVWMDKKEILVNGRMFDIKTIRLEKGRYEIYGHYDDKESKLLRLRKRQEESRNQHTLSQAFSSLQTLFFQEVNDCFPLHPATGKPATPCTSLIPEGYLSLITPPPKS